MDDPLVLNVLLVSFRALGKAKLAYHVLLLIGYSGIVVNREP